MCSRTPLLVRRKNIFDLSICGFWDLCYIVVIGLSDYRGINSCYLCSLDRLVGLDE